MGEGSGAAGSIWEDGLGNHDGDARVLWEGEEALTADPQSVRYGDGKPARVVAQAVVGGNNVSVQVESNDGTHAIDASGYAVEYLLPNLIDTNITWSFSPAN